jgi:hypothetical protein
MRSVALCVVLMAGLAAGGTCPAPRGGSEKLAAIDSNVRAGALQGWLWHDSKSAALWNATWIGINAALTVGQGVGAPFFKMPDRADWVVGAISTAVNALGYAIFAIDVPQPIAADYDHSCAALADLESRAQTGADSEAFGISIWSHLLCVGLSIVPGLILGLAYDRWVSGALLTGGGILLGELAILTTPTGLLHHYDAYLRGEPSSAWEAAFSLQLAPVIRDARATGLQLALTGSF